MTASQPASGDEIEDESQGEIRGNVGGLVLAVADIRRTARFLTGHLGFLSQASGEGWEELGNGALRLRLERGATGATAGGDPPGSHPPGGDPPGGDLPGGDLPGTWLDLETEDFDATVAALVSEAGLRPQEEEKRVGERRREQRFGTGLGFGLVVSQELTEDDLGVLPELPAGMDWDAASDLLVRRVLRSVPLTFRHSARRRSTQRAEAVALASGAVRVEVEHAVRGLFEVTPEFQLQALTDALHAEGVDAEPPSEP